MSEQNAFCVGRFFDSGKEFSVFGEDGNGVTGFDVLNVQKNTDGTPHYVKVMKIKNFNTTTFTLIHEYQNLFMSTRLFLFQIGSYGKGELILDRNKLTFYNGDVEAKCGQDHCQECKRQTGTSNTMNGGMCGSLSTDDLQMRNVDTAIIVILAVVCVLLVMKTVYDTYRLRSKYSNLLLYDVTNYGKSTTPQGRGNIPPNGRQIILEDHLDYYLTFPDVHFSNSSDPNETPSVGF